MIKWGEIISYYGQDTEALHSALDALVEQARLEERAACVKFIEEWGDDDMFPRDTAAAIQEAANALRRAPAGDAGQEGEG